MQVIKIPYSPRPQQKVLHDALLKYRFAVCVMHRRGGKTIFSINHLIKEALTTTYKDFRGAFFCPTRVQAKQVAWDYVKEYSRMIPGMKYNETELRADFPNGARITLFGSENIDAARGLRLDLVVNDEYAQIDSRMFSEVQRPAIADRQGKVIFIGTPNGMDAFYHLYEDAKANPEWFTCLFRASETKLLPQEELDSAKKLMTDDQYKQEFEVSFTANVSGAVYGKFIEKLEEDKRIGLYPYDVGYPVDVYFDLGISDKTCLLFTQTIGRGLFVIDCYDNSNYGLDHYAAVIKDKNYLIRNYIFPHDVAVREMSTGHSRQEYAYQLGMRPIKICPKLPVEDGLHAGQMLLSKTYIDRERCKPFLDAMKWYHRKYMDKDKTYSRPVHDWSSHYADCWRYVAVAHQELDLNQLRPPQKEAAGLHYNPLGD